MKNWRWQKNCGNMFLSATIQTFRKDQDSRKKKPTSFPREYTSSAFCHIIRLSLNNHIRQKQTCCCIPGRDTFECDQGHVTKNQQITNHSHKIPNRDLGLIGSVVFLMVVRGAWPRINQSQCSFCWVKVYVYNKCSYSYFWVDFTFLCVLIVFTAITRISRLAYTCSIH